MTWRETIERARVWIECGADLSSELLRSKPEVLTALAALTAQIEELEGDYVTERIRLRESAESAEYERELAQAGLISWMQAATYLAGFDVPGWPAGLRADEVLERAGLEGPVIIA